MTNVSKVPIQTFVFFDLEATDLTRPRITELCLLSVQREELLTREGSPRIVNKLTICVHPQKPISLIASDITGLYNDSLESQTSFDKNVVDIITLFLSRLPQPVCLVAHYGNGFDYPLLNAELKRAKCELSLEVLCVDSLDAVRSIDTKILYEEERALIEIQNQNNTTPVRQGIQDVSQNDFRISEDQTRPACTATVKQDSMHAKRNADTDSIDHVRKRLFTGAEKNVKEAESMENKSCLKEELSAKDASQVVENSEKIQADAAVVQQASPQQPMARAVEQNVESLTLKSEYSATDDMLMAAVDFIEANENPDKTCTPLRKCLNSNGGSSTDVTPVNSRTQISDILYGDQGQTTPIVLPRLSYKLEEIYLRTFGQKPPLSHNAEDDCVTLMKVCKKRCPQFIEWADQHQVALSSVVPIF
ncbi:uncharacterized protein LOC132546064 [Ylistrum balloti]|uniref:uncharacterized protein LOC132546064 n=1 Tax=Ylistrum balloti TaxID=509963 RepID=UPI002905E3AF|nr:uncharacterized protein LOC132546064 [Ylistrum balloti]